MDPQTVYSDRSDSGGYALLGFGLAVGFVVIGIFDHPTVGAIIFCGVIATIAALFGVVAFAEVLTPAELQLTSSGFDYKRPLRPRIAERWNNIGTVTETITYRRYANRASYPILDSGRVGSFLMHGANTGQLVELMNDYRERALTHPAPTADVGFGHRNG